LNEIITFKPKKHILSKVLELLIDNLSKVTSVIQIFQLRSSL
jgi:hypothetical protein